MIGQFAGNRPNWNFDSRVNGVKETELVEEMKEKQRREGARQILEQIKFNTENRLLEEEKKNAEAQALVE